MCASLMDRERSDCGMMDTADVVVLGGGLAGLTTGSVLGSRAVVVERAERPGGLVRTENFDGYWFDRVIHLLYFSDPQVERRVHEIVGAQLHRCPPVAYVELQEGKVRYPFQSNLAGLPIDAVIGCIHDFAAASFSPSAGPASNYEQLLRQTFGNAMCEMFFLPYNRKMWQRDLRELAPSGFQWNLARPDLHEVLRGAFRQGTAGTVYNAGGWYPRPEPGAPQRGMEILARALADRVCDLRLRQEVEEIDVSNRTVRVREGTDTVTLHWRGACVSTLPLPLTVALCRQAPVDLRRDCASLSYNRVRSVAISIKGPRPAGTGHWRYYVDESVCFTRLVYMCEFDPAMAPEDGWALLAEVPERGEDPPQPTNDLIRAVRASIEKVRALPAGCQVVGVHVLEVEHAYVVFTPRNEEIVRRARTFLRDVGIEPLGRYGRWEYSSMAQVMGDAFRWADAWCATNSGTPAVNTTANFG
jgi:protoporphyrinogen oxidase